MQLVVNINIAFYLETKMPQQRFQGEGIIIWGKEDIV